MTQDRQFSVPLYQRHYRWRTDQQDDLWQDILEQYEAIAEGGSSVPRHFIGSVVAVELSPDPLHDFRSFRVVDGQQRLTTLSVAIAALRDVAATADPAQFDRFNAKYLVNTTEEKGSERWARLVPGDEDAAAYWTVLTDPEHVSGRTAVGNAYRFFRNCIEVLAEAGDLQPEKLASTIGDRLSLVFVTVEEEERPHKIFESINATGVGLSQADLLRNYLFMALRERSNAVYNQYWRPLELKLGTEGLEGLVRDDLQSAGEFVRHDQVYRHARAQLEPFASDIDQLEEHVKRLARRGSYYAVFLQPTDATESAEQLGITPESLRHLRFLRAWGATTTYPVLLHLYAEVDAARATVEEVERCLAAIESFIVRRYLADVPTNVLTACSSAWSAPYRMVSRSTPPSAASCRGTPGGPTTGGSVRPPARRPITRVVAHISNASSSSAWSHHCEPRSRSTSTASSCRSSTSCRRRSGPTGEPRSKRTATKPRRCSSGSDTRSGTSR